MEKVAALRAEIEALGGGTDARYLARFEEPAAKQNESC
jgi:hypothetical protein